MKDIFEVELSDIEKIKSNEKTKTMKAQALG